MKWIQTSKQLPAFNGDVNREDCTYDPVEVSEKLNLFCEGDDQYRMGWFCRTAEDGKFFEVEGIGDASIGEVVAWMQIPQLTVDSFKERTSSDQVICDDCVSDGQVKLLNEQNECLSCGQALN